MPTEETREKIKSGFGRALLVLFSVLLQIFWFLNLGLHIFQYNAQLNAILTVLSWILALHVYGRHMNAAYRFSWIILILLFPVLGIMMYLFFGSQVSHVWMRRSIMPRSITSRRLLMKSQYVVDCLKEMDRGIANQAYYIQHSVGYPVYQNTNVVFHANTMDALEDLKAELKKAKKFIFMEYHAIEASTAWNELESILAEKAESGVDVRIIYDDVGSIFFVGRRFKKRLQSKGIQCRVFNPIFPIVTSFMNNRDHRKITVIDGRVGFTGGYNLADRYFNITHPYGYWKDTGIKIIGEAVSSLTVIFFEMWNATQKEVEDPSRFLINIAYQVDDDGYVQPYADTPLDHEKVGENVYLNMIKNAKCYLYIATPYLIIDDEMQSELTLAAARGVDVRIITPGIPDKKMVYRVTRSYYARLIDCGVRIYEYTPGFLHAKQFVCDGEVATVGTINLDFRSLYLHFENGCWFYHCKAVQDVKKDFERMFCDSEEVTKKYSGKRSLGLRSGECILRLLSPLM